MLAGRARATEHEREQARGCERSVCVGVSGGRRVHAGTQGVCVCERVWE